jgi:ribosomal-protein-serine acetyltransferase
MFKKVIDDEIYLYLVNESFTQRYAELVSENNEYLAEWLAWPYLCKKNEDFKKFFKHSLYDYADGKSMNCAIEYYGEIVGNASFNNIDHNLKVAEIGYWLGQKYQGNGIITRVCKFLMDYAFTGLKLEKIQISVAEHNTSSRAVCERLGLKLEGVITNKEIIAGKILNHAICGIHSQT